jgi:hypothetical protein
MGANTAPGEEEHITADQYQVPTVPSVESPFRGAFPFYGETAAGRVEGFEVPDDLPAAQVVLCLLYAR